MGNWIVPYLSHRSGPVDRSSSYKILEYFNEFFWEFVAGLILAYLCFVAFLFYSPVPPDPTLSVLVTNQQNTLILVSIMVGLVGVLGVKCSYSIRFDDVQANPYMNLFTFLIALLDGRVNAHSWWYIVRTLLYMAANSAGAIASAFFVAWSLPTAELSPLFLPTLAQTTINSRGGVYLIGCILYFCLFRCALSTMVNGTMDRYVNLIPFAFLSFAINIVYLYTCRMTTNFAINWAFGIFTGYYQVLWLDALAALTAIVVVGIFYFIFSNPYLEPQQVTRFPEDDLQITYKNAAEDSNSTYPEKKKKSHKKKRDDREEMMSQSQATSASTYRRTKATSEGVFGSA